MTDDYTKQELVDALSALSDDERQQVIAESRTGSRERAQQRAIDALREYISPKGHNK
jgi:hypothetical protein